MELSYLLAQVIGLYLVLEGILILTRRKFIINLVEDFSRNKALMFVTGAMVFLLGLLIVLNHNIWEASWRVVPTLIGWAMVVKGVAVLFVPKIMMHKAKRVAKNRNLGVLIAVFAVAVGAYLVYVGFGLGA